MLHSRFYPQRIRALRSASYGVAKVQDLCAVPRPMIRVTYPAWTLDRSSPLGNRQAPLDNAYHVAGSEYDAASICCT
nr:MAG TPA: hypothetical protein [Caudoviricetes sp.]